MADHIIALFSSDARELYKADVYRALALPVGYVLHFRYPKEFVQVDLLTDLKSIVGQNGVIFYVAGNDTSIASQQRQLTFFSIRSVVIKDVVIDQTIDSIHFYLELGAFIDALPQTAINPLALPPTLFVTKIPVDQGPNGKWADRVDAVKTHFPDMPFFFVESVRQGTKRLSAVYSASDRSSTYPLNDESDYQVDIVTYDPGRGLTGLTAENGSAEVTLSIPTGHRIGAESDAQPFRLQTHSLSRQKVTTYTSLLGVKYSATMPTPNMPDFRILLEWTVTKKWTKAWQFGLLSSLAAVGVALAKLATDDIAKFPGTIANACLAIAAVVAIGAAAGLLYVVFNKK